MRALLCRQWGPPEDLAVTELPEPVPGEQQVLLEVRAAAVNFPDTLIIQNKYQFKPQLPFAPGGECAGVVKALGPAVSNIKVGDAVIAFTGWGAMTEQLLVDARQLIALPDGLDFTTASAFVMTYATSYHALKDRCALLGGETLLVLGASGGVGLAAIEIGKLLGARVIAAASSAKKLDICKAHGADELINYSDEDLRDRIKALTGGKGVDVVYDPVGGSSTETALRSIAWRGRLAVVGFANGSIPALPANLALLKGASIVGVFWGDYAKREPANNAKDLRTLFGWLMQGKLKPHIYATYPLDQGGTAIRALMDRGVSGKLVVLPQE